MYCCHGNQISVATPFSTGFSVSRCYNFLEEGNEVCSWQGTFNSFLVHSFIHLFVCLLRPSQKPFRPEIMPHKPQISQAS